MSLDFGTAGYGEIMAWLRNGGEPNTPLEDGSMPLHWAAGEGRYRECGALLRGGADVNARDRDGSGPLHWAASQGHAASCGLLLGQGADPVALNCDGLTPLHLAAREGYAHLLEVFREPAGAHAGIDVATVSSDCNDTLLHCAAACGQTEFVSRLLSSGAGIDDRNFWGTTALHYAVGAGCRPTVEVLLDAGADPRIKDDNGATPLDLAPSWPGLHEAMEARMKERPAPTPA